MKTKTNKCDPSQLFGLWAIDESRFRQMVESVRAFKGETGIVAGEDEPFERIGNLAVIDISGPMTKHDHSFQSLVGGTSTTRVRRALRTATEDPSVKGIVVRLDSPGGTVAGTSDLAGEVRRARKSKHIYAIGVDMVASAAYWVASQTDMILANDTAMIGSIGVISVLYDQSQLFKKEGVEVHVIATGEFKGTGVAGTKITDDQLKDRQREVDELAEVFTRDVAAGRGLTKAEVMALADGRVHVGAQAKALSLIDHVMSFDDAIEFIEKDIAMKDDPVGAFASAQPDAVAKWKAEGKAEGESAGVAKGVAQERERMNALTTAFADRPAFAIAQFAKGHSVDQAKAELAGVLDVELKASQAKVADLEKKAAAATDGHPGVPFSGQPTPLASLDDLMPDQVDAVAKLHWDRNVEGCRGADGQKGEFTSIESYRRFLASVAEENARIALRLKGGRK